MKKVLLLAFAIGMLGTACQKEEVAYVVTIDIQSPSEGAVVAVDQPMNVKVVYTRADNADIHHVNVYVVNTAGQPIATLVEEHVHTPGEYVYETTYTPNQTGSFKLQAITTDDSEGSPNMKEAGFVVQ